MGIYNNDPSGFTPTTLVIDGGTIDGTLTGPQSVTISQALTPGVYWVAGVIQGNPATKQTMLCMNGNLAVSGYGYHSSGNPSQGGQVIQGPSATGALPSTCAGSAFVGDLGYWVRREVRLVQDAQVRWRLR